MSTLSTPLSQDEFASRYPALDAVRGLLFTLGLFLHAAWICRDQHAVYQTIFDLIHSFRMEGFFLIAGFFSARSMGRVPLHQFVMRRTQRLVIPWLSCYLLFAGLEALMKVLPWKIAAAMAMGGAAYDLQLTSHLWFLPALALLTLAVCALHQAIPDLQRRLQAMRVSLLALIAVLSTANFAVLHWTYLLRLLLSPIPQLVDIFGNAILYSPWFFAGYLIFCHQELLCVSARRIIFNVVNIVLFLLAHALLERTRTGHFFLQAWKGVCVVSVCALLLWCADRTLATPSAIVSNAIDASYTVYIMHWPIMALSYEAILHLHLPSWLLYVVLVVIGGVASYIIHASLVRKHFVLKWLLNGSHAPAGHRFRAYPFLEKPLSRRAST